MTAAITFLMLVTGAGQPPENKEAPDPAKKFIEQMDKAPADKRPPNWEVTKALMARVAPKVGQDAPDFSLTTLDGKQTVKLSQHKGDRPVVLIFGSFT